MVPPVVYCTGDLCDPISKIAAVNFHRRRNRNREQRRSEGQGLYEYASFSHALFASDVQFVSRSQHFGSKMIDN